MENNSLKYKLKNNMQTYGSWITISNPLIPEIISQAGFDWLCIDMEHSSIDIGDALSLVISIENNNIAPLVRVGENNANLIKRVMDVGAYGVIVPNVNSLQDAQNAVQAVKYPPAGKRGVGLYRAQKFGNNFDDYLEWLQNESIVVIQIEHINAVKNIEEIFSVPNIDAFIIGPYDLSGSMGIPGDLKNEKINKAIDRVLEAAKKHQITAGFHCVSSKPEDAKFYKQLGFRFLGFSLDSIFLGNAAIEALKFLKSDD